MKQTRLALGIFAVAALITACAATGPTLASVKDALPALDQSKGRLFFYREYAAFGSGMQPDIQVCGQKVGESTPGGVFYVDLPEGECDVTIPAIVFKGETRVKVRIARQGVQYLRTSIGSDSFNGYTNLEIVPEQIATKAMPQLAMTSPVR